MRRVQLEKSSFEALIDVIRVLQTHQIPYMLVGAFSSNAYGYPRATKDADIVIEYEEGVRCSRLVSVLPTISLSRKRLDRPRTSRL
jgi:hypothetical protein